MAIKRRSEGSGISDSGSNGSGSGIIVSPHSGRLEDSDFVTITKPTRQANILIYGDDGTGKTSFCVRYAPDPIMVLNFDGRADDVVYEAIQEGREVKMARIALSHKNLPPEKMKIEAERAVEKTIRNFEIAIEESRRGNVRTILLDTATEYSEILKLAFDGTLRQTKEGSYGKDKDFVNRQWWRLFDLARETKSAHVIVTARAKEIWRKTEDGRQESTGRFTYRCSPAVHAAVDWAAQIRFKTVFGIPKPEFEIEITKAGTNREELFEVYDEKLWDKLGGPFIYACVMNYKESTPDDWK